jgi:endonuclease YncB( thermonuclease family)
MPRNTLHRIHTGELKAANDDLPRRTTRRQRWLMVLSLLVSIVVGAGLATCAKAEIVGTAEALDGDDVMITMSDGSKQRVRLLGIDSPRTVAPAVSACAVR